MESVSLNTKVDSLRLSVYFSVQKMLVKHVRETCVASRETLGPADVTKVDSHRRVWFGNFLLFETLDHLENL